MCVCVYVCVCERVCVALWVGVSLLSCALIQGIIIYTFGGSIQLVGAWHLTVQYVGVLKCH